MARLASCCRRQAPERSMTRMPRGDQPGTPLAGLLVRRGEEEDVDASASMSSFEVEWHDGDFVGVREVRELRVKAGERDGLSSRARPGSSGGCDCRRGWSSSRRASSAPAVAGDAEDGCAERVGGRVRQGRSRCGP